MELGFKPAFVPTPRLGYEVHKPEFKRLKLTFKMSTLPLCGGERGKGGGSHIRSRVARTQKHLGNFSLEITYRGHLHVTQNFQIQYIVITHVGGPEGVFPHWLPRLLVMLAHKLPQCPNITMTFKC